MTIDEIEKCLPNGFHDATLRNIEIDYLNRNLRLEIDIDVSNTGETKIIYETVKLNISGLICCAIEPPDMHYYKPGTKGAWLTGSDTKRPKTVSLKIPSPLPDNAFEHYFYCSDWNSFISIVAMDANLERR